MSLQRYIVSFTFVLSIIVSGNHAIVDFNLHDVLARLSENLPLKSWNSMSKSDRIDAVLKTMYANETLRNIVQGELVEYGFLERSQYTAGRPFPCTTFASNATATSVHRLTPADIRVVAALGDSLSAGNGLDAKTAFGCLIQYRGKVFSVGGDNDYQKVSTVANFLKRYNPNLKGFSTGTGGVDSKGAHFNVAVPGSNSLNLMDQVNNLISRMKTDQSVNFEQDWKLITLFIGNNDICDFCEAGQEHLYSPQLYRQRVQDALDKLSSSMPRTLVNLVTLLDVSLVYRLNIGLTCNALHFFECRCAAFAKDPQIISEMNDQYQKELADLVATGRYDSQDDFTVVAQPFFHDTKLPIKPDGSVDLSYFAPDCFHLSGLGHESAAVAMWNNMFQPVGKKKTSWEPGEDYVCPSPLNPYITTAKNSKV